MKNLILGIFLLISTIAIAQVAPIGVKTLVVKETFIGEYNNSMSSYSLPDATITRAKKTLSKKLPKYGFINFKIKAIGVVGVPYGWASKLHNLAGGNEGLGYSYIVLAGKSKSQRILGRQKMREPERLSDKKWQAIVIDGTGQEYKIRINMLTMKPKYIIKQTEGDRASN